MKEQDFGDRNVPWTQDWSRYLDKNGFPPIVDAEATASDDRVTVDPVAPTDDGTSVTFYVTQDGMTSTKAVAITVHVTLAGGTELEQDFWILFTNI